MREIRDAGKVTGTDRIAVMTALNFAHELLRERRAAGGAGDTQPVADGSIDDESARRRIQSMQTAIDQALAGQDRLF
jgi:cell division protein ZapA